MMVFIYNYKGGGRARPGFILDKNDDSMWFEYFYRIYTRMWEDAESFRNQKIDGGAKEPGKELPDNPPKPDLENGAVIEETKMDK